MYITRDLEREVLAASKHCPIVVVWGLRQTGKTTMLRHIQEQERNYVTLDDISARTLAETDPALFLETYKPPLLIDVHGLYESIFKGGMPRLLTSDIALERFFADYVQSFMASAAAGLALADTPETFQQFLVYMAARTSLVVHYDEIADSLGIELSEYGEPARTLLL